MIEKNINLKYAIIKYIVYTKNQLTQRLWKYGGSKMLKKVLLSIVLGLFITFSFGGVKGANAIPTEPFNHQYQGASAYQSPFDPHFITKNWPVVYKKQVASNMYYVIFGNPQIPWQAYTYETPLDAIPAPEGELCNAVHVLFVAVQTPQGQAILLFSYGYMDKDGVKHSYQLNPETNAYELMIPGQPAPEPEPKKESCYIS